jgi:hypothetical protein
MAASVRLRLQTELVRRWRVSLPPPDYPDILEDLRKRVTQIASQSCNKPEVQFFGSFATGFCKADADADFSLTYRSFDPYLQGITRIDEQDHKKLFRFSRTAVADGMKGVRFVDATIPVVQMEDPGTSLKCDVTIGNLGGVENSRMLRRIHDVHPVISLYVHTVKEWAKSKEVIAPEKMSFNSFTMTTMAIMVLQELGILPVFVNQSGELGELTVADVEAALKAHALPQVYKDLRADDDAMMGEALFFLFERFALYYKSFDFVNGTVSLMCPRRLRTLYKDVAREYLNNMSVVRRLKWEQYHDTHLKEAGPFEENAFSATMQSEEAQRNPTSFFIVEDFANFVNCGRRVHPQRGKLLVEEFGKLHGMLTTHIGSEAVLSDMFVKTNRFPKSFVDSRLDKRVKHFD